MATACKFGSPPPKSFANGGAKPLEGEALAAAKDSIKDAITSTDKVFYGEVGKQLPTAWQKWKAWTDAHTITGTIIGVGELQQRVTDGMNERFRMWEVAKRDLLWPAANNGQVGQPPHSINVDEAQWLLCFTAGLVFDVRKQIDLVNEWNKGNVGDAAIRKTFGDIAETLGKLFDAVKALADGVADTAKYAFDWLPWIIGGALILPFALRTFSAYRRGGAAAAADEAAGQIERGRASAGSAISTGARKLLTRGVAGVRRRRR